MPGTPEALLLSASALHDFGARTFRIYAIDEGGVYARAQFDAGETIPGTVSAAVAERNACIGELFNCEAETDLRGGLHDVLRERSRGDAGGHYGKHHSGGGHFP